MIGRTLVGILILLNASLGASLFTMNAEAHSAATYYPVTWSSDATAHYVIDNDVPAGWVDDVQNGMGRWDDRAGGKAPHFVYDGTTTGTNDFNSCDNNNTGKWYVKEDLGAYLYGPAYSESTLGTTHTCTSGGTGVEKITKFQVTMERTAYPNGWHTGDTQPPSNQWDLRSIVAHESGHTTGFYGHFTNSTTECPATRGSGTQTMCSGDAGDIGTQYLRTLETHDTHTIDSAYP